MSTTPPVVTTPPTSLVGSAVPEPWKEFTADTTKSADENAAAKTAHDATKPADAPLAAATFTPVDFAKDIKLPEGFAPDDVATGEFTSILNDPKLSRAEMAQKLVDLQAKNLTGLSEKGKTDWETLQTSWQDDATKEFGAKLPVVTANIGKLLNTYSSTREDKGLGLRSVFDLTGAGNSKETLHFLDWVASKLNEGTPASPASPGGTPNDAARTLFPSMTK